MYCPYCGNPVGDTDQKCNQCGKSLTFETPQTQSQNTESVPSTQETPTKQCAPVQETAQPSVEATQQSQDATQQTAASPYGQSQQQYAQQPYAQQPYAQQPYAQQPYAQQPYAQPPYMQQPYAQPPYVQPKPVNCPYCGHLVVYGSAQCPTCHNLLSWVNPNAQGIVQKKNNTFAIIGFIASLVALFYTILYIVGENTLWLLGGVAAIVFGVLGLVNCKKCQGKGKIFSILAIIFGALAIVGGFTIEMIYTLLPYENEMNGGFEILFRL